MLQYESAYDAFDTKIRHLMSSLQVQYTSHARILTGHYQYQHSLNQGIFNISNMHLTSIKSLLSLTSLILILPVTSKCSQMIQLSKTNISHVKQERKETEQTHKTERQIDRHADKDIHAGLHYNARRLQRKNINIFY